MDAPEPGQPDPDSAAERGGAQPDEGEDLLAAMQAARGDEAAKPADTAAASDTSVATPAADAGTTETAGAATAGAVRKWGPRRRRVVAVVALLGVLVIAAATLSAVPGFLSPAVAGTARPSVSAASSGTPVASASLAASPTGADASVIVPDSAAPSPSQSLPAQTAPAAQVTFNELVVYPGPNAAAPPATFEFVSDGPGLVSASIVASAPRDATRICLSGDGGTPVCGSGATPTASFYSQSTQSKWTVTIASASEQSPTVDLQITWPSNKGAITATHLPFQGHPNRDSLRSLTATFTPRVGGSVRLEAAWPGSSLATLLTVWLVDKSGQRVVDQKTYGAAEALPSNAGFTVVAGSTYRMTLADESDVSTTNPDLTATLRLP